MVERELENRLSLLDKGFSKLRVLKSTLDKLKPDVKTFTVDGAKTETWSAKGWEDRNKLVQQFEKLEVAINNSLNGEGFDKLKDLVEQKQENWKAQQQAEE